MAGVKPGPDRIYDVNVAELPPFAELVELLELAGVGHVAAGRAAAWVELVRAGHEPAVSHVTEIRYRRNLAAAAALAREQLEPA